MRVFLLWLAIGIVATSCVMWAGDWLRQAGAQNITPERELKLPAIVPQSRPGTWQALADTLFAESARSLEDFRRTLDKHGLRTEVVRVDASTLASLELPAVTQLSGEVGGGFGIILATDEERGALCLLPQRDMRWLALPQVCPSQPASMLVCTDRDPGGLWFPTDSVAFGLIDPRQPREAEVWIPVLGEDVLIESVTTDCGCVGVMKHSKVVTKGESLRVELTLNASSKRLHGGQFSQKLAVKYHDEKDKVLQIRVTGIIEEFARFENPVIDLAELRRDDWREPREVAFKIYDPGSQLLDVMPVDLPVGATWLGNRREDGFIHVRFRVIPAELPRTETSVSTDIRFLVRHKKLPGSTTDQAWLSAGIIGTVIPSVEFVPNVISVGLVKRGDKLKRQVQVVLENPSTPVAVHSTSAEFVTATYQNGVIHCDILVPDAVGMIDTELVAMVHREPRSIRVIGYVEQ